MMKHFEVVELSQAKQRNNLRSRSSIWFWKN